MNLATKLVSLRKQNGLTQMELAERINVTRQAISRWEVGTAVPSIDNLKVLGDLYKVPVDYLLNDDYIEIPKPDNYTQITKSNSTPANDMSIQNATQLKRKYKMFFFCVVAIVASLFAIIFVSKIQKQKQVENIPIAEMTVEEDDNYDIVTFSLE